MCEYYIESRFFEKRILGEPNELIRTAMVQEILDDEEKLL